MLYRASCASPLGVLTMFSDGDALVGLQMEGEAKFADAGEHAALPLFGKVKRWLEAYFAGERPAPRDLPLLPQGGAFRRSVWEILLTIPYGECRTYGGIASEMARIMGKTRMAAQAVGGAVGHNPVSIVIPCHRVIGARGNLTGYAGGMDRKIFLLRHEGLDMAQLFVPTKKA